MNKAQLIELLKDYPDDTQIRISGGWGSANLSCKVIRGKVPTLQRKNTVYLDEDDWDYTFDSNYDFVLISGE